MNMPINNIAVLRAAVESAPSQPVVLAFELDEDTLLSRDDTAMALTAKGYTISPASLSTMVSRGDGPPYVKFGARPLYRWGTSLDWAKARTSKPVSNSAEHDAELHERQSAAARKRSGEAQA